MNKKIWSWALFDWANSAFATSVLAGFFPILFQSYFSKGVDPSHTTSRLGIGSGVSSLICAVLCLALGIWADRKGRTKFLVMSFSAMTWVAVFMLSRQGAGDWASALFWFLTASLGFNIACSFYDALLPAVLDGDTTGRGHMVSALGYSMGYLGGGVLFLIQVLVVLNPEKYGFDGPAQASLFGIMSVAIWWAVFSLPLLIWVPEVSPQRDMQGGGTAVPEILRSAWNRVCRLVKSARQGEVLSVFLVAYWIYIDGVYTVVSMAVDFGVAIGLSQSALIQALLLVQFIGFPAALFFGWLGNRIGVHKAILGGVAVYLAVTLFAVRMQTETEFYILAAVIGLVQGGVQTLSRSYFAQLVPAERAAEEFGLFNIVGRFAAIVGPMLVGVFAWVFGSSRAGILALVPLFLVGGALLWKARPQVKLGEIP